MKEQQQNTDQRTLYSSHRRRECQAEGRPSQTTQARDVQGDQVPQCLMWNKRGRCGRKSDQNGGMGWYNDIYGFEACCVTNFSWGGIAHI